MRDSSDGFLPQPSSTLQHFGRVSIRGREEFDKSPLQVSEVSAFGVVLRGFVAGIRACLCERASRNTER